MPRPVSRRRLRVLVAEFAGWLVLSFAIVVPSVASYITLSPIDELQHIDSTIKASQLHIVQRGEKVSEPALRSQSCRGIDSPGFVSPPCDAPVLAPESFQEAGDNTAAVHPPTYYLATGLLARLGVRLGVVGDIVTAARLVGAVWLAAGLMLTAALGRALGASRLASTSAAAALAASPVIVLSSTTVTPDAAGLLSGAAVALVTVRAMQGRASLSLLAFAGAAANAFKLTGILVVAAGCLALVVHGRAWRPSAWSVDSRGWLSATLALAGGGLAFSVAWTRIAGARALEVTSNTMSRFEVTNLSADQLLGSITALLPPTQNSYLQPELRTVPIMALLTLMGVLVVGAVITVALRSSGSEQVDALGVSTLVFMLLGGPVFVLLVFFLAGSYFPIPSRYGLVLLPAAMATLAAVSTPRRPVGAAIGLFAAMQVLAMWLALSD